MILFAVVMHVCNSILWVAEAGGSGWLRQNCQLRQFSDLVRPDSKKGQEYKGIAQCEAPSSISNSQSSPPPKADRQLES